MRVEQALLVEPTDSMLWPETRLLTALGLSVLIYEMGLNIPRLLSTQFQEVVVPDLASHQNPLESYKCSLLGPLSGRF